MRRTAVILVTLTLSGCGAQAAGGSGAAATQPAHCRLHGALPDPRCTPGATDPHVNQADIRQTICKPGYTRGVRPPEAYTTGLKRRQLAAYGWYAGRPLAGYEEDHLIPLELGGAPSDPRNLWPEARQGPADASQKDVLENRLHMGVCEGAVTLRDAQREIAHNWEAAYLEGTG